MIKSVYSNAFKLSASWQDNPLTKRSLVGWAESKPAKSLRLRSANGLT